MSEQGATPAPEKVQITAWLDSDRTRRQLHHIARARKERDVLGWGATVVVRRAVDAYIRKYRNLLPDDLRD